MADQLHQSARTHRFEVKNAEKQHEQLMRKNLQPHHSIHPVFFWFFRAISRVLSLWFEFGLQSVALSRTILKFIGKSNNFNLVFLSHLRPFVYQIASRLDHHKSKQPPDVLQEILRYLLKGLVGLREQTCLPAICLLVAASPTCRNPLHLLFHNLSMFCRL